MLTCSRWLQLLSGPSSETYTHLIGAGLSSFPFQFLLNKSKMALGWALFSGKWRAKFLWLTCKLMWNAAKSQIDTSALKDWGKTNLTDCVLVKSQRTFDLQGSLKLSAGFSICPRGKKGGSAHAPQTPGFPPVESVAQLVFHGPRAGCVSLEGCNSSACCTALWNYVLLGLFHNCGWGSEPLAALARAAPD